ncbi:sensor histidine kinase [Otoolea muris]|uniref:sensor histidine kinase n=1 Tax=Otoolea muris TaxID=2941515 RepID=UPI002041D606|nr:GHKL domain-containing protein [Otoolea muris]
MDFLQILRPATVYPCHSVICYLMSEHKYGRKTTLLIWAADALIWSALIVMGGLHPESYIVYRYVYVFSVLAYMAAFIASSTGGVWKNVFLFVTYVIFFLLLNGICMGAVKAPPGESDVLFLAVRVCVYGLSVCLLWRYILPAFRNVSRNIRHGWGMLAAVSALYLIFISAFGLRDTSPAGESFAFMEAEVPFLTMNVLLLAIISTSYVVIFRLVGYLNQENSQQQLQLRQKMLEHELCAEKEYVAQARRFQHDLRHHNRLLAEYLSQGRVEEAAEYLRDYEASTQEARLREFCAHPVANALLCITQRRCEAGGICFKAKTQIPEQLPLSAPEAGLLFGNLLENAWEGCEASAKDPGLPQGKPELSVYARAYDNKFCLEVKNTVARNDGWPGGLPSGDGGGIGIGSIRAVLEKYKGMLQYRMDGDQLAAQMILPLARQDPPDGEA